MTGFVESLDRRIKMHCHFSVRGMRGGSDTIDEQARKKETDCKTMTISKDLVLVPTNTNKSP